MFAARTTRAALPRASRRLPSSARPQARFQSTTSTGGGQASSFASGAAGGAVSVALCYLIYLNTAAGKAHAAIGKTAKEASETYKQAAKKLQESSPDADQAYKYVKDFCYAYVGWVPGGRQYVDTAFKDYETVRENHRDEVNQIVSDAYKQLQGLSKSGFSMETARKAYDVLADISKKISNLAGDSIGDLMSNHPELKEKVGSNVEQLKRMGDQYGPEAKKQAEETWKQLQGIVSGGFSASNLEKARELVQEKTEQVRKMGDQAWDKGMKEAMPYLDKYPGAKKLLEENQDALKKGNTTELFQNLSSALEKKDFSDFEKYVKSSVDKAKSKGSQWGSQMGVDLDSYFKMIPSGGEILPKLKQLKEIADNHKGEGEKLFKDTMEEVKRVLEKKSQDAQRIADQAKKEAK